MFNKKANLPILKVILILFTISIIFISFMFFFFNAKNVENDYKKLNTQIAVKKILSSKCFSQKYGEINEIEFTIKNLNKCFENFDEEIYLNIGIKNIENKNLIKEYLYLEKNDKMEDKEKEFKIKASLCSSYSTKNNLYCSTHKLPIRYINDKKEVSLQLLEISIIV